MADANYNAGTVVCVWVCVQVQRNNNYIAEYCSAFATRTYMWPYVILWRGDSASRCCVLSGIWCKREGWLYIINYVSTRERHMCTYSHSHMHQFNKFSSLSYNFAYMLLCAWTLVEIYSYIGVFNAYIWSARFCDFVRTITQCWV